MAYTLAERWPGLPQVLVVHSPLFDFQLPPLVPVTGSVAVVLNERVAEGLLAMAGDIDMVRLRQPIDTSGCRRAGRRPVASAGAAAGQLPGRRRPRGRSRAWRREGVEVGSGRPARRTDSGPGGRHRRRRHRRRQGARGAGRDGVRPSGVRLRRLRQRRLGDRRELPPVRGRRLRGPGRADRARPGRAARGTGGLRPRHGPGQPRARAQAPQDRRHAEALVGLLATRTSAPGPEGRRGARSWRASPGCAGAPRPRRSRCAVRSTS